jgi:hypothetical protein
MLFSQAIIQAEWEANAPLREAMAIKRERWREGEAGSRAGGPKRTHDDTYCGAGRNDGRCSG